MAAYAVESSEVSESRRAAVTYMSHDLLARLLKLPKGIRVRRVTEQYAGLDEFMIVLEGDELPSVWEHAPLPQVQLKYRKEADGSAMFEGIAD